MHDLSQRLSVARLTLTDFRNFRQASVTLDACCVVLTGTNGSGKTNCLEAVSLLAPGRGLRGSPASEFGRYEAPTGWSVAAKVLCNGDEITLGTGLQKMPGAEDTKQAARRMVRINGDPAPSSAALGDIIDVVWLAPSMDGLFTGPASDRRRFLDRITGSCHPSHRSLLARFDLAMRQRNRLLHVGETRPRLFEAYERQMAEAAVAIAAARVETVDRLRDVIGRRRQQPGATAFPWALVSLQGDLEDLIPHTPAIDIEDEYTRGLAESRDEDRMAGRTKSGPHASDLVIGFGPKEMPARVSSTGEQKSLMLGLILAQAELVKTVRSGQPPLILLDEVAAHLDESRRESLFQEIIRLDSQAWMTGTEADAFSALEHDAQFFHIADGAITGIRPRQTRRAGMGTVPKQRIRSQ